MTPRFPPQGPGGSGSPASPVLSGRYDSLPPIPPHFVFLRLAVPPLHLCSLPRGPMPALGPGGFGYGASRTVRKEWRRQGLPRSRRTPIVPLPCSSTPAGSVTPGHTVRRRGPRSLDDEGSHEVPFEAQSHGFDTCCLRFAGWVTPPRRKTRFRLLARLYRAGLSTRRVPPKGFRDCCYNISFPFPELCVAQLE